MAGRNPYCIDSPALIQFSGGRSSGMMLHHIIEAHDGALPDDVHVLFANTGKERPETLNFVQECGSRFGVRISWIEYRHAAATADRWTEVSHNSASRNGEPFREMVEREASALPNPVMRLCTGRLKVRPIQAWARANGIDEYTSVIGYRADERHRVVKTRARAGRECGAEIDFAFPLHDAGVTKRDVAAFWKMQPFDLRLPNINNNTPHGNCDLCFLKSQRSIVALIREAPERADWWIEMESLGLSRKPSGATFRKDRPNYRQLRDIALAQGDLSDIADDFDTRPCGCHD